MAIDKKERASTAIPSWQAVSALAGYPSATDKLEHPVIPTNAWLASAPVVRYKTQRIVEVINSVRIMDVNAPFRIKSTITNTGRVRRVNIPVAIPITEKVRTVPPVSCEKIAMNWPLSAVITKANTEVRMKTTLRMILRKSIAIG